MGTRSLTAAAVLATSWACHTMQPVPVDFIAQAKPAVIDVKGQYGVRLSVTNPRVSGDTIFGTDAFGTKEIAVPLREIDRITTRRFSSGRTAMLIGGAAVLGGVTAYFMLAAGEAEYAVNCENIDEGNKTDRDRCG